MGTVEAFPAPLPAITQILARFDRQSIEAFITVAVDLLDVMDAPHNPDEPDFTSRTGMRGAGLGDDCDREALEQRAETMDPVLDSAP